MSDLEKTESTSLQDEPRGAAVISQPAVGVVPKKSVNDFILGNCIGEGSFSTVYLAVEKQTRKVYAVKICDKHQILRERKQEYVRREREVLQIMANVPGFVKLMCAFQDTRSLYFVMAYAQNGELLPHIKRVGCFSVECARHYGAELVLACEQMHRRNVVHRDLKPENILLDQEMHTLVADFGSAKVLTKEDIAAAAAYKKNLSSTPSSTSTMSTSSSTESDDLYSPSEPSTDDVDAFYRPPLSHRKRKGSFVGTAQYISPEVLQNEPISPSTDLWALGCILYQMISGLPPFQAFNDFAVFKEILACNIHFPDNFDQAAEDLVRQLLRLDPKDRLGAQDDYAQHGYTSIRAHPFFAGVDFETIRQEVPPKISPFVPNFDGDESETKSIDALGTELERVLGLCESNQGENKFDLIEKEKQRLLALQSSDKWHPFADKEIILMKGLVQKRKGLFATKFMLLLTTGPHLMYIDPVKMMKHGEVPWGPELRVEVANNKVFFIHTVERTYFFNVLEGSAQEWKLAIEKVHSLTFKGGDEGGTEVEGTEAELF